MVRRMRWLTVIFTAGVGAMLLAPAAVDAQKKGKKDADESPEQRNADFISDLMTAHKLAESGRKEKAPERLITAAGMLRQLSKVKVGAITDEPVVEDEKGKAIEGAKAEVAKEPSLADEANELFDEAQAMGLQLKVNLDGLIKLAKWRPLPPGYRDVVGGPRSICRKIRPRQTQVLNFHFVCGRPAAIGFRASFPMRIQVVRDDIGHIWIDALTTGGVHNGVPGGNPSQRCRVTFRIINIANQVGEFRLFIS